MSTTVECSVTVDENQLIGPLKLILDDSYVQLQMHNELARIVDPWVPFLEGALAQTIEVTEDGVTYTQPYARRQYYGLDFNHTIDYHPLASAQWDKAAMTVKREEFVKICESIINRRLKELYGR